METFQESIPYLAITIGMILLISCTAYGACYGMTLTATSSSLYTQKKQIITYSYIATIMSSSIFFQGFILVMIISRQIDLEYKITSSICDTCSCLILAGVGYAVGILMGSISKKGFKVLYNDPSFSISFILLFATAEVILLFAFMASLTIRNMKTN